MKQYEQVNRWIDRLISAVRNRADDRLAQAEEQIGVSVGYLRRAQYGNRNIMLAKLLCICVEAKVDPGEVCAEVFPEIERDPDLGLPIPKGSEPAMLRTARRRMAEDEVGESLPALDQTWLDHLDELRYDDPLLAIRKAEHAIEFVSREEIPRTLGIWASACRLAARFDHALMACRLALDLVRGSGDHTAEVDLLRRASFVVASVSGNFWAALKISENATAQCARSGGLPMLGRFLVDQGTFLVCLERHNEAEQAFLHALDFLATNDRRNRFAALQGLGVHYYLQGKPQEALDYSVRAAPAVKDHFEFGKMQWLNGCILADLERWDESCLAFEESLDHLLGVAPVDAALSACDHIRVLLAVGRIGEARQHAASMRRLIDPLAGNLVASAAIRDLIRCEQEGQRLTITFLEAIKRRLERGRREIPHRP